MDERNKRVGGIDAAPASPSIYATLPEADAIRLLELYPASDSGTPLVGSLVVTTLRDCRDDLVSRYTALSYVWGDPAASDTLTVDEGHGDLGITSNLATALRDIRHTSVKLTLWVDAICINQGDLTERARQVQIMGEIYAAAGSTIIYLGSPLPGLDVLFETVHAKANVRLGLEATTGSQVAQVGRKQKGNGQMGQARDDNDEYAYKELSGRAAATEADTRQALAHAIEQFCSYSWFGRSWVFQELVLSKDPRVQCGAMRARWTEILDIVAAASIEPRRGENLATSSRLSRVMDETRGSRNTKNRTMAKLIRARAGSHATDPRDYFFSLMGLVSDLDKVGTHLQIDYRQSVQDVYVAAASYALEAMGLPEFLRVQFDFLSSACTPKSPLRAALPGWVPDWSIKTPWTPARTNAEGGGSGGFTSSSSSSASCPMVFRGRLTLPVIDWEWLERMKPTIPPDWNRIEEISAILPWGSEYPSAKLEKSEGNRLQSFNRQQDSDYLWDGWFRPLSIVGRGNFSPITLAQDDKIHKWYMSYSRSTNIIFRGRPKCRLARLVSGFLHVVPASAAVGDFVFDTIDMGRPAGPNFPNESGLACCVVGRPLLPPDAPNDGRRREEDEDAQISRHMAQVWRDKPNMLCGSAMFGTSSLLASVSSCPANPGTVTR